MSNLRKMFDNVSFHVECVIRYFVFFFFNSKNLHSDKTIEGQGATGREYFW